MGPQKRGFWKGTRANFQKFCQRLRLGRRETLCEASKLGDAPQVNLESVSEDDTQTIELKSMSNVYRGTEPFNIYDPSLNFGEKRRSSPLQTESFDATLPQMECQQATEKSQRVTYNRHKYNVSPLVECPTIRFWTWGDTLIPVEASLSVEPGRGLTYAAKNTSPIYVPAQNFVVQMDTTSVMRKHRDSTSTFTQPVRFHQSTVEPEKPIGWVMLPMPIYAESSEFVRHLLQSRQLPTS